MPEDGGYRVLEHVRNRYKLPTSTMDEGFVTGAPFQVGITETDIRIYCVFIQKWKGPAWGDHQLSFSIRSWKRFTPNRASIVHFAEQSDKEENNIMEEPVFSGPH